MTEHDEEPSADDGDHDGDHDGHLDGGAGRRGDPEEHRFTVDLLVRLLLDDLAPAAEAYRRAVAKQLDLEPVDLLCLDVVRRLDATPSSALTAWTGLTRSALSKSLRRLERAGHVSRRGDELGNGEVVVSVVAREDRDRRLDELRGWSAVRSTGWSSTTR